MPTDCCDQSAPVVRSTIFGFLIFGTYFSTPPKAIPGWSGRLFSMTWGSLIPFVLILRSTSFSQGSTSFSQGSGPFSHRALNMRDMLYLLRRTSLPDLLGGLLVQLREFLDP